MNEDGILNNDRKMTSVFERFLSLWVILCIIAGILLGKIAPGPVMLMLVKICLKTTHWFKATETDDIAAQTNTG